MLAIVLGVFGLGFCCWLLFTLAIYALPFLAGVTAGLAAFDSGGGVVGALIVGFLAGGATLALGQIGFATTRTPLIRAIIGLLYAVPATVAVSVRPPVGSSWLSPAATVYVSPS